MHVRSYAYRIRQLFVHRQLPLLLRSRAPIDGLVSGINALRRVNTARATLRGCVTAFASSPYRIISALPHRELGSRSLFDPREGGAGEARDRAINANARNTRCAPRGFIHMRAGILKVDGRLLEKFEFSSRLFFECQNNEQ